ncbi:MAG: putative oxidoreductase [Microvirga sp.]|jgi:glycine/D-amino acid oxidase-like deaminating enzyme|nr:putative oxidoreductase [Microvirga sp.]
MANRTPEQHRTLWWHTAAPRPVLKPVPPDLSIDVAVIGAGFTGLTAALHLTRRGASVLVMEADTIGSGASGFNAGFVVPNFAKADPATVMKRLGQERGVRLLELVGRGGERIFETIRDYRIDCDAAQTGWLQPAHSDLMADTLKARVESWCKLGRPLRYLDALETAKLTGVGGYRGALFDPTGGTIHPLSYVYGLAKAAQDSGAFIQERAPATSIERAGEKWILQSPKGRISARRVLLCTNASTGGVARRLSRTIVPLSVYQIATKPLSAEAVAQFSPQRHPVSDTRSNLFTYRLDRDNRLISGGMSLLPIGAHRRMGEGIAERLARELSLDRAPEIEHVWRGIAAMTTDFLPHIYEFGPGFIGGIGCNGRGVAMTAMLGKVLADAALGMPLARLPVPEASTRPIPFHFLAKAAPSFAIGQARWQDWRAKR